MSDSITLSIGGILVPVPVGPMTLSQAKDAQAAFEEFQGLKMATDRAVCGTRVIAAALRRSRPDLDARTIEGALLTTEIEALNDAIAPIMIATGLYVAAKAGGQGEDALAAEQSLST